MHSFFVNQKWAAVKKIVVFYYGEGEGEEAKRLAISERTSHQAAIVRDAAAFDGEIEQCTEVVVLPNVPEHQRKKIQMAYRGDLVTLRGSSKWYGGEIKTGPNDPDAQTDVIVPDTTTVHGPKRDPEEVSRAVRPDSNLTTTVTPADSLGHEPRPVRRGRPPKASLGETPQDDVVVSPKPFPFEP